MFGIVVPGAPLLTAFTQVTPTRALLTLPTPITSPFPQLTVCLLTSPAPIPPEYGAAVYIGARGVWEYLGHISASKPSAILDVPAGFFSPELASSSSPSALGAGFGAAFAASSSSAIDPTVQVGISIDSMTEINNMESGLASKQRQTQFDAFEVSKGVAADLFKFMSSYTQQHKDAHQEYIVAPTSVLDQWIKRVQDKLLRDPFFWRKTQDHI